MNRPIPDWVPFVLTVVAIFAIVVGQEWFLAALHNGAAQ
jgi:hypothetical protein